MQLRSRRAKALAGIVVALLGSIAGVSAAIAIAPELKPAPITPAALPPAAAPPRVAGVSAPPPAWAELKGGSRWLAYGSFCWARACVDMIDPAAREDIPLLPVAAGEKIVLRLPLLPSSVRASLAGRPVKVERAKRLLVPVSRSGLLNIVLAGADGEISFLGRVAITR